MLKILLLIEPIISNCCVRREAHVNHVEAEEEEWGVEIEGYAISSG